MNITIRPLNCAKKIIGAAKNRLGQISGKKQYVKNLRKNLVEKIKKLNLNISHTLQIFLFFSRAKMCAIQWTYGNTPRPAARDHDRKFYPKHYFSLASPQSFFFYGRIWGGVDTLGRNLLVYYVGGYSFSTNRIVYQI